MITRRDFLKNASMLSVAFASPMRVFADKKNRTPARYWHSLGDAVACELCPNACVLAKGKTGICRTRENVDGKLVTNAYANPCAVHVDPIEKKPLYHVLPGARAFSLAIAGCNLRCLNCQNYTISQVRPADTESQFLPPEKVVEEAKRNVCTAIAYTYSEPIVWYEYVTDTAKLARAAGLKNVLVTNGYINEAPLRELAPYIDAANINLKSFNPDTYKKLNGGTLEPQLKALVAAKKLGIWVEVTNLVVPMWTDDMATIKKMCAWIKTNLGDETPLHFSRFFPMYKLQQLYPTPGDVLTAAKKIAEDEGLKFVYVGNVAEIDANTYCPGCKKKVIARDGMMIKENSIKSGKCGYCGKQIPGVWG